CARDGPYSSWTGYYHGRFDVW
nr:immunoglobulin heavy chain junction region [Macaca mulatta]MOV40539.1 immunoglobulin heavy chain junction region [Macaca mulatta]